MEVVDQVEIKTNKKGEGMTVKEKTKKATHPLMVVLSIKKVIPSKTNPRKHFDEAALKDLTESIRQQGIISPILVRPQKDKYEIVAGERRYRAAREAGILEIPVIVRELDDNTALEIQVVENLHRTDLHPLEEAEGYEALIKKHGYKTVDDIAAKVGKSRSYVYARMKLCQLIPKCRKMFYSGDLTASTALLIARMPNDIQEKAAKKIIGYDDHWQAIMSYREAKEYIHDHFMLALASAPFDILDPQFIENVGCCKDCQKRTGSQPDLFNDIKGADVCTDLKCFNLKKKRGVQKKIAETKASGKKVLSAKESKKIFNNYGSSSSLDYTAAYIDLNQPCYDTPKSCKYKTIVNKTKHKDDIVLAVAEDGELFELIPKGKMPGILKEYGVKSNSSTLSDTEKEQRKKTQLRKKAIPLIMDKIMEAFEKDTKKTWWRLFAEQLLSDSDFDTMLHFCRRQFPDTKKDEIYTLSEKILKETPDKKLMTFCFELIMTSPVMSYYDGFGDSMTKAAKLYNVKMNTILKSVQPKKSKKKKLNQTYKGH